MKIYLILTITFLSSLSYGVDIEKCNLYLTDNPNDYVNHITESLYHSITRNFEEFGGKLNFASQRFPLQLDFKLNKSKLLADEPTELTLFDMMTVKNQSDSLEKLNKISNFYKPFVSELKQRISHHPLLKDKVTVYSESLTSVLPFAQPHLNFYADIHLLKILIKDILENPISSVFGEYEPSRIVFHTRQYKADFNSFENEGVYEALNKTDWFESPQHHEIMRGHASNIPHESIATSLNIFEETMVDIKEQRINFTAAIIKKTIDFEVFRTKQFRSKGWIYFKNQFGQSRFNVVGLEDLIFSLYVEKQKDLSAIVDALNNKMNQLPYNRYLFVPWSEEEVIDLISHKLSSTPVRELNNFFKNQEGNTGLGNKSLE